MPEATFVWLCVTCCSQFNFRNTSKWWKSFLIPELPLTDTVKLTATEAVLWQLVSGRNIIMDIGAIQIRMSAVCSLPADDCKAVGRIPHCSQPRCYRLLWMILMWDAARGHLRSSGNEMRIRKHANPTLLAGEKRHNGRGINLLIVPLTDNKVLWFEGEE